MNYADALTNTLTSPAEFAEATEEMFHDAFLTDANIAKLASTYGALGAVKRIKELEKSRIRSKTLLLAMMRLAASKDGPCNRMTPDERDISWGLYSFCQAYAERNCTEEFERHPAAEPNRG